MPDEDQRLLVRPIKCFGEYGRDAAMVIRKAAASGALSAWQVDEATAHLEDIFD